MVVNLLVCAAACACGAGPLDGARSGPQPVVVIDRSLRSTTGELVSLREGVAAVKLAGKEVTVERPVAVVSASAWGPERDWPGLPRETTPQPDAVTVELTDGSLLRGDLLPGKSGELVLVHPRLGKIDFSIDTLREMTLRPDTSAESATRRSADTVRLVNGDRVEGFVESIAPMKGGSGSSAAGGLAVTIERTGEKTKTTVPLDRVAWVAMSGGGETKGKPPVRVWLGGEGERTAALEFSVDKREARIVRSKGSLAARVEAAKIDGAALNWGAGGAVALASCPSKGGSVETGPEQALGTRDLTIPEPGDARWALPAGAARISGWAVLPEECRRWGDCRVTITASLESQSRARPVADFTLNGAQPVVALDADLPVEAGEQVSLWVTVSEGKNGPVQDRVVLRRVLVGFEKAGTK